MKLLFDIGDIVETRDWGKGQIICMRAGMYGAKGVDLLCADGKVHFKYLHDLTSYNPDKMEALK